MNKSYRNYTLGSAVLTGISGAATTYSSSEFVFTIDGKVYTKAAVSGGATPAVDGTTGAAINLTAGNVTVVVWGVNAAGTVSVYQGNEYQTGGALPQFPFVPDSVCAFAYTMHTAGSTTSGTWTFGTGGSNWNATGMTHTVVNLSDLPSRPQAA